MAIYVILGFIAIIVFVTNSVAILKKVKNDKPTIINTIICCITFMYIWGFLLFCCSN
ncbi:hypothetical protein SAMN02745163_01812 [Clostridium cavendishii DSM 21758]|uniref:Uncharacterized protein n=1 Tax=Clostridium cavendishii DSM 21758 TaxID=1121302 RepID=A0A1M6ITJ8_9CLOT|nr:hypothetical protein [Clostridium cavendishii]SHJ37745.1 hypothetical protein SAMN02745163_01812 [Clostridium cavendishii DSM 21758]